MIQFGPCEVSLVYLMSGSGALGSMPALSSLRAWADQVHTCHGRQRLRFGNASRSSSKHGEKLTSGIKVAQAPERIGYFDFDGKSKAAPAAYMVKIFAMSEAVHLRLFL